LVTAGAAPVPAAGATKIFNEMMGMEFLEGLEKQFTA